MLIQALHGFSAESMAYDTRML